MLVGKVRAKQYYSDDHDRSRNMGVLLHGDGSFSGQGVVYETLDMSALQDYTVGGVIHIVVNNQVRLICVTPPAMCFADLLTGRPFLTVYAMRDSMPPMYSIAAWVPHKRAAAAYGP